MINTNTIINKLEKENNLLKKKKATITRKHFEAIAKIINNNSFGNECLHLDNKRNLVNAFCNYFKTQNKNFNSFRFYNACFINELGSSKSETVINTVETLKVIFKPKESEGN